MPLVLAALLSLPHWAHGAGPAPAEAAIGALRNALAANPDRADTCAELAIALARRARETSDTAYYDQAEAVALKALALSPGHLGAERARIWARLGKHEFAEALALAQDLNKRVPDDLLTYGFLVDAYAELGRYAEAENAAQWMLDLRPGNIPAFARAAYLRELFGDVEGAIQLMEAALERTPSTETEDRAWFLTQLAHLELMRGRVARAELLLTHALELFPDYHYALGNLARVRLLQQRPLDAVALLERRYAAAPHAENLYALADAHLAAGATQQARTELAQFEQRALAESGKSDNANRELVYYYADHARRPADALRIARLEIARRRDVFTLEAYGWALHVNGRDAEGLEVFGEALAVGIQEPVMLYRAAVVAASAGDATQARKLAQLSLAGAPQSEVSERSRRLVERLPPE